MKSPLDDTIWGAHFGSVEAIQSAFDRFGIHYHNAILATGVPYRAAEYLMELARWNETGEGLRGIDLGCGSGVLGIGLRKQGFRGDLEGIDISLTMLELAKNSGYYSKLSQENLLDANRWPMEGAYDFIISVGLVGDYLPYYYALPQMARILRRGGMLGLAVEQRSTPYLALARLLSELSFTTHGEISMEVDGDYLEQQTYQFIVAQRA